MNTTAEENISRRSAANGWRAVRGPVPLLMRDSLGRQMTKI